MSRWKHRSPVFGAHAIFIHLITEIGLANLFINFAGQPHIGGPMPKQGAHYRFLLRAT